MAREIIQEYIIGKSPGIVFDALISPRMIQKWWFANSAIVFPEDGGIYAATWREDIDNPDYISVAKISGIRKPELLVLTNFQYRSKDGRFRLMPISMCNSHSNLQVRKQN
jgi:uncharacterized protein YndB with AHSA1/START domain